MENHPLRVHTMKNSEFQLKISQTGKPVIVDFWAPWCGPCKIIKPNLEKLAQEYSGRVDLWEINADENPDLLRELKIFGVPTLIGYNNGKELVRYVGAKPRTELKSLFDALSTGGVPNPNQLSTWDRFVRLLAGSIVFGVGWAGHFNGVLLVIGGIVMFSAVHDRRPIWKAITTRFKKIGAK